MKSSVAVASWINVVAKTLTHLQGCTTFNDTGMFVADAAKSTLLRRLKGPVKLTLL